MGSSQARFPNTVYAEQSFQLNTILAICPNGGFPSIRHNEICDLKARLLIPKSVMRLRLNPNHAVTGNNFILTSSNTEFEDTTGLDISANVFSTDVRSIHTV